MQHFPLGNMAPAKAHILFLLALLIAGLQPAAAQSGDPLLEHFAVQADQGDALLIWITRPGTTCEGVDIERSLDSINWERIYNVPGICGGPDAAFSYSYRDEAPVPNRRNHYRLRLGALGHGSTRTVLVVDVPAAQVVAAPQPAHDQTMLLFPMAQPGRYTIAVLDRQGQPVRTLETTQAYAPLDVRALPAGLYYTLATDADGKRIATGKLVVQH